MLYRYQYQEWELKSDGRVAGDTLVREFLEVIRHTDVAIDYFIYRFDRKVNRYLFHFTAPIEELITLPNSLQTTFLLLIRFDLNLLRTPLDHLLGYYHLEDVGELKSTEDSDAFPAPIEWGGILTTSAGKTFLIVHHDGDPLTLLTIDQAISSN